MVKLKNLDKFIKHIFKVIDNHQDEILPFPVIMSTMDFGVSYDKSEGGWLTGQSFMNRIAIDSNSCIDFMIVNSADYLDSKDDMYYLNEYAILQMVENIIHEISHVGQFLHGGFIESDMESTKDYIIAAEIANDRNTILLCERFIPYINNELGLNIDTEKVKRHTYYLTKYKPTAKKELKYIPVGSWKNKLKATLSCIFSIDLFHLPDEAVLEIIEKPSGFKKSSSKTMNYLVDFRNTNDDYFMQASIDISDRLLFNSMITVTKISYQNNRITIALEKFKNPHIFSCSVKYDKDSGYSKIINKDAGLPSYPNKLVYDEQYNY